MIHRDLKPRTFWKTARFDLSNENAGHQGRHQHDAHSIRELGFITAGLNQTRRAWLESGDVLDTLDLAAIRDSIPY